MRAAIRYLLLGALAVAVSAAATGAILAAPAAAAPFTSPDGLWTWSRPLPFGYPAKAISAPAPGELFVATTVGDLLTTTDGGASWGWSRTSAVSGFGEPQDVQFVSATEGWTWSYDATLEHAILLHTTDGGVTWQSNLTVPASPGGPLEVRFAGPLSGWVVTGPGGYEYCELYTTTDGGQTWSAPRDLPSSDYNDFQTVAPQGGQRALLMETVWSTGADNGEIVGTQMWRTTDGGATWLPPTMVRGGADIGNATFSSATKGWTTGESWPSGDSWLWRTTNGGVTWHKVRRAPGAASVTTVGNDVWVVGYSALHSSDGGKTWKTLPRLTGTVSFSDPSNGWIADGATLQRTTDGGRTWQHVTPAPKPWGTAVSSLAAVGGETVWGAAGRVIKTTDGGQHWRFATKRQVNALAAVSALRAWAVGPKGLVIHTSDGGHHWTRQSSGVTVGLRDVFFVDARHGWAGGGNTLLRTIDSGRHWTHKHPVVGASISQLDFADASHGIALLNTGQRFILFTNNGGRTWAKTQLPVSKYRATAVIMQDATHALIIAWNQAGAATFTSSDGGKSWQLRGDLPNNERYVSITRSGSLLCAVGDSGVIKPPLASRVWIVTSRDDGATWSDDGAPSGGGLTSVQFVGADTLMIGGYLGILTRNLTTAPLP
jgi:photosystem II stability/assembly factor-like uncharacterized protein